MVLVQTPLENSPFFDFVKFVFYSLENFFRSRMT